MKVLIIGRGLSGRSAGDLLERENVEVVFAAREDIEKNEFEKEYLDRLFSGLSFIVTSPGISPKIELIKQAKSRKIKIIGEFEFGSMFLKSDIIAVTGTNGKTTTVSLIHHILKGFEHSVFLGGNIGIPVSSLAGKDNKNDISVLECSSFQLENIKNFSPKIAAILNISPDHLNRHRTMKNYIKCKFNITKKQTENDYLILNADDEFLFENPPKTKAQIFFFSTKKRVKGCYIKRNCIYFNDNQKEEKLVSLRGIKLVGEHNLSNILCACLAVFLQTKNKELLKLISGFTAVSHRIEFVKKISGVEFYNDSKATNISSTIVACKSFKNNIHLILGGSDKGYEFDELFKNLPKNVKNIAIFGETRHKIAFSAQNCGFVNYKICDSLEDCTKYLFKKSREKDIVLLSPACASFDCFSNYKERGNFFKKIVEDISDNENINSKKTQKL